MKIPTIRANDPLNDWTFGQGRASYKTHEPAVEQDIKTSLQCWLNDCFWAMDFGVDWANLLGSRGAAAQSNIILQCREIILGVFGVVSINSVTATIDARTRRFSVQYDINDIYSQKITNTATIGR